MQIIIASFCIFILSPVFPPLILHLITSSKINSRTIFLFLQSKKKAFKILSWTRCCLYFLFLCKYFLTDKICFHLFLIFWILVLALSFYQIHYSAAIKMIILLNYYLIYSFNIKPALDYILINHDLFIVLHMTELDLLVSYFLTSYLW